MRFLSVPERDSIPRFLVAPATATLLLLAGPAYALQGPPTTGGSSPGAGKGSISSLPGVQNLGVAVSRLKGTDHGLVFAIDEAADGKDRNGDGDMTDHVVAHYVEGAAGFVDDGLALAVLGIQPSDLARPPVEGDVVLFEIGEFEQGMDLNGDGDAFDWIWAIFDASTSSIYPQLFDRPGSICKLDDSGECIPMTDIAGSWVALQVAESFRIDWNGDGDMLDGADLLVDLSTGQLLNPMLAGDSPFVTSVRPTLGPRLAFLPVSEAAQGATDLNGNGTANEILPAIVDLQTGQTTQLSVHFPVQSEIHLVAPFDDGFLFAADEEVGTGTDYNQDGDTDDDVLHVYRHSTHTVTDLGYSVWAIFPDPVGSRIRVLLSESHDEKDYNGDGDMGDPVFALYDPVTDAVENTGAEGGIYSDLGSTGRFGWNLINEGGRGGRDLNGDGDFTDDVPVLVDGITGKATILPIAVLYSAGLRHDYAFDGLIALPLSESEQGSTDWNGDGDALDTVLAIVDTTTGAIAPDPLATPNFSPTYLGKTYFYFVGDEAASSLDLNGDGDTDDEIWQAVDRTTLARKSLLLPYVHSVLGFPFQKAAPFGDHFAVVVDEADVSQDLNGDGDEQDDVLVVVDPRMF